MSYAYKGKSIETFFYNGGSFDVLISLSFEKLLSAVATATRRVAEILKATHRLG